MEETWSLFLMCAIYSWCDTWCDNNLEKEKKVPFPNSLCNANTFRRELYLSMDFSKFSLGSQCDLLTYIELKAHQ